MSLDIVDTNMYLHSYICGSMYIIFYFCVIILHHTQHSYISCHIS